MSAGFALAILAALLLLIVVVAVRAGRGQRTRGRDDGSWRKWTGGS